jgi:hypothetical protein
VRLLGLGFALLLGGAADAPRRIELKVTTIRETGTGKTVLSEALIDGPPGTDFTIDFRVERFVLHAGFTTDVVGDELGVDASLDTKRLYGVSERNLPLYEEDVQRHSLRVGFDEAMVLLPFGGGREGDRLEIVITPSRVPGAGGDPPRIRFTRPAANGIIDITARKIPHRFRCEARLVENGREVGRGGEECRFDAARELSLADLVVRLTVDGAERDGFSIHFDVDRSGEPVSRHWAGAGTFGEELTYDLGNGRELKLAIRPVE